MHHASHSEKLYAERAGIYDKMLSFLGYERMCRYLLEHVELSLPPHPRILDLGCGTGLITETLMERFPDAHITGLDASQEMLSIFRERFPDIPAIHGDFNNEVSFKGFPGGEAVRCEPESFDLIVSTGALTEYGDPGKAVPLAARLLAGHGMLLNIGVERTVIRAIGEAFWRASFMGSRGFIDASRKSGFRTAERLPIPARFFPRSYINFFAKAEK